MGQHPETRRQDLALRTFLLGLRRSACCSFRRSSWASRWAASAPKGRPFLEDLAQAERPRPSAAYVLGGVDLQRLEHPALGLGIAGRAGRSPSRWAWVWRWCWAWSSITLGAPKGDPVILFLGVVLIVIAIVCNGIASGRVAQGAGDSAAQNRKGIHAGGRWPAS